MEDKTKESQLLIRKARTPQTITVEAGKDEELHIGPESTIITYVPDNTSTFSGAWEATGGSLGLYGWNDCDANTYSTTDKQRISDPDTSQNIYGAGGGSSTEYTYCHWMKWQVNENPTNISEIRSYAHWTGTTQGGGPESITKALYIGNEQTSTWQALDTVPNAWSAVEHNASVANNIGDYVEEDAGDYYVYTLLHYNASKSGGGTGAYSNYYYTTLEIVTNNPGGTGSTKGLVNTTIGATPFYTTDNNPETVLLSSGQCTNLTWAVNSTGDTDTTHEFFTFANKTSNTQINDESAHINLTILAGTDWTLKDHSENNHDLTNNGATTTNGEASFDGTNQYLNINNTLMNNHNDAFSISGWFELATDGYNNYQSQPLVTLQHVRSMIRDNNKVITRYDNGSARSSVYLLGAGDRDWHHFVSIVNNSQTKVYVDGTLRDSDTHSYAPHNQYTEAIAKFNNGYFNGTLDDIRIFNTAIQGSDVTKLYQNTSARCNDLVAWYPFETDKQTCNSGPTLVHEHTFESTNQGWGGGTHSTNNNGYYEETNNWSTIYSGNLDLTDLTVYRIEMIVWNKDSQYAKFYPNSQQMSGTEPHFFYERNGGNFNIKFYNGSYYTATTSAPQDKNITWIVDVNRTSACINASFTWDGGSAHLTKKCGANIGDDYLHWNGGEAGAAGHLRIMEVNIYDLG